MGINTCFGTRFARRVLLHAFLFFACFQHCPINDGSSFGFFPVAAEVYGPADTSTSEDLAAGEEQIDMMIKGAWGTGHLASEKKRSLHVNSRNEPVSPRAAPPETTTDVFAEASWVPPRGQISGGMAAHSQQRDGEGVSRLETGKPQRLRANLQSSRKLDGVNSNNERSDEHEKTTNAGGSANDVDISSHGEGRAEEGTGMAKFRLGGRVESYMVGSVMQEYLNQLVAESVAATDDQTCNIAFVKTHKTASTTAATIFYRYGKRHKLNVANFDGHQSSIELPDAVKHIQESGKPVDLMHYHHAWDGFYEGRWDEAKAAYRQIMRDPSDMKLVTVMREPVSHYLSYYYYFLQPETGLSIAEYIELSKSPDDPRYQAAFQRQTGRRNNGVGWHGFKLLHNPLCVEFGIRTAQELEDFIRDDLPDFAMILLTEQFEEGLAVFMRMFNWRPIDMTYCRVIETKAGVARYDGKMLANVPKIHDLPPEVVAEIKRQTQLDQALYKAAAKIYLEKRLPYEDRLEADVHRIRTVQSAVHGYLDFDPTSPAHEWYEGDVHCFADPSPVQPF